LESVPKKNNFSFQDKFIPINQMVLLDLTVKKIIPWWTWRKVFWFSGDFHNPKDKKKTEYSDDNHLQF